MPTDSFSLPHRRLFGLPLTLLLTLGVFAHFGAAAQESTDSGNANLADLSLEELTDLQVSSVAKKPQRAADAPAAVFVITQDDIRRSGTTSIPQALRLVPGLQVAQIDGNKWAISARGFNSRFANRLLVLMDGRTLYTLTFGGVFWDAQDTMIEDIERIEVVRGPGGAVWGTNAFNGVVNIITKSASQTGGGLMAADTGTQRPLGVSARLGSTDSALKWRMFGKAFRQDGNINFNDGDANDDWRQARIGGRVDLELPNSTLQISTEAYRGKSGMDLWDYDRLPELATLATEDEYEGAFATLEWSKTTAHMGRIDVRAVADYTDRDSLVFDEQRNTYDLEVKHTLPAARYHDVMWGLGVRHTADSTHRTAIAVVPADDALTIYHGFLQDEIALLDDALHVTAGGRIEHSDYIGTQFMPNLRTSYNASERSTVWAAISRGIRSASRLERDVRVTDAIPAVPANTPPVNPTPAPLGVEIWGDPNFAPEKLKAFELGWRQRLSQAISFDIAAYYNQYSGIRGVRRLPTVCAPSMTPVEENPFCVFTASKIIVPIQYSNLLSGNIWGAELTVNWNPLRNWRLVASYAYLEQDFENNPVDFGDFQLDFAELSAGLDARNQWTLRSSVSLNTRWDWDLFLRHVDALPTGEVAAYTDLNTRIAWRPRIDFELALTGENLLHDDHREFVSDFVDLSPVSIKRAVHLQARWSF